MGVSAQADPNSKLMLAWTAFQQSEEFANAKRWAENIGAGIAHLDNDSEPRRITVAVSHPYIDGSLWALFMHGYKAACEDAAVLAQEIGGREWMCIETAHVIADEARTLDARVACPATAGASEDTDGR